MYSQHYEWQLDLVQFLLSSIFAMVTDVSLW